MKYLDYMMYFLKHVAWGCLYVITIILILAAFVFLIGAIVYRWWFILFFILDCLTIPSVFALLCCLDDKLDIE